MSTHQYPDNSDIEFKPDKHILRPDSRLTVPSLDDETAYDDEWHVNMAETLLVAVIILVAGLGSLYVFGSIVIYWLTGGSR